MLTEEEQAVELTEAVLGQELLGGSGANTIVIISSFGVPNDRFGQIFGDNIYKANVAFDTSPLEEGTATARSIIRNCYEIRPS